MKETWSMVLPTLAVSLAFFVLGIWFFPWVLWFLGSVALVLAILMLNFFRDFERRPVSAPALREVISPADGKIVVLKKAVEKFYLKKPMIHIAIFMNPLNNHVQRAPFDGKVIKKVYHPGEFLAAYDDKADLVNEQTHLVLELDKKKGMKAKHRVVLKQIAGLLCRRVKTDSKLGAKLKQGERFGRILLGSRVDIFLPLGFESYVKNGDQVRAGLTVLGKLP
jgi:phosphatidylserine decarboxylase